MAAEKRVLVSWSTGKDAAWTLQILRTHYQDVKVVALISTMNQSDRVAMHAVRRELLQAQATMVGLPSLEVELPWPCSNAQYESLMAAAFQTAQTNWNVTHVAFGDLFLADIREYREALFKGSQLTPLFPLWNIPTRELAHQMIDGGLRAYLICVDPRRLSPCFAGRLFDKQLLADLPSDVDPCGENGEFHTFVFDGPMFTQPVTCAVGDITEKDNFVFADLVPLSV